MRKHMKMMAAGCMALTVLAGCGGSGDDSKTIKIGVDYEQTGGVADYGKAHVNGIKLAVKEINKKGGVNGKKLELVVADNKSEITEVGTVTTKLMTEDEVVMVLGPATSGNTSAAINVANKNKVPVISASATANNVTENKDGSVTKYGYKICYSDNYQGEALAKFALSKDAKRAVIVSDSGSDYAKGLAESFKKEFANGSGTIVASKSYQTGDTDFKSILTSLKSESFDVMFVPGYYQEAGPLVKQAREMGIDAMILGPDGFDSENFIKQAGNANLNNVFFSTHFSKVGENQKVKDFVKKYQAAYDKEPGRFEALGYDLAYYAADVIKRAGKDVTPETVNKALGDTKAKFSGVTGSFTMKKDHTPDKVITVVELKNGEQVSAAEVK